MLPGLINGTNGQRNQANSRITTQYVEAMSKRGFQPGKVSTGIQSALTFSCQPRTFRIFLTQPRGACVKKIRKVRGWQVCGE